VVGVGDGEMFFASSIAAFLRETRRVKLIEDGEIVAITRDGARFFVLDGSEVERDETTVDWDDEAAEKQGYETFMLKEIYEQPEAIAETIGERIRHGRLVLEDIGLSDLEIQNLRRMVVISCGTSYHAGLVGRYVVEEGARVPCEPDIASEWRYRNPVLARDTLVVGISQSGETADTIAAMRVAREKGARTLAITNMMGTQITREVDSVLYTRAGIEMGVAATKTFTAQVTLMYLLALRLAEVRRTLPPEEIETLLREVASLPDKLETYLAGSHPIDEIALRHYQKPFFLYLGRHIGLPVCLEGALKLKEISYIPTEAYSAGEMKHGPIALLDDTTPVVCIATDSEVYDKVISNIQETRARGADVIAIATDGNEDIQHHASDVIYIPRTHPFLQAALAVIPLQQLAYRIARLRGLNVDQPRNLAKTVTVE
jgi:glucosamine--fructose-6-phosphate aminotransferase (isomerizing)